MFAIGSPPLTSRGRLPAVRGALAIVENVNAQLAPLNLELKDFARRQPGSRALMRY